LENNFVTRSGTRRNGESFRNRICAIERTMATSFANFMRGEIFMGFHLESIFDFLHHDLPGLVDHVLVDSGPVFYLFLYRSEIE